MLVENQREPTEKSKKSQLEKTRPTITISHELNKRFSQGDFYSDITLIESMEEQSSKINLTEINYPLCVLLNQDCDLNSDFRSRLNNQKEMEKLKENEVAKINNDKDILWLFFAPVYIFAHFLLGEHLSEMGMKMSKIEDNTLILKIKQNEISRYHFLKFEDKERLPEMIIDFKHYFTVSYKFFQKNREKKFLFSTIPLFRESISQRFANYLSRIGLPDL